MFWSYFVVCGCFFKWFVCWSLIRGLCISEFLNYELYECFNYFFNVIMVGWVGENCGLWIMILMSMWINMMWICKLNVCKHRMGITLMMWGFCFLVFFMGVLLILNLFVLYLFSFWWCVFNFEKIIKVVYFFWIFDDFELNFLNWIRFLEDGKMKRKKENDFENDFKNWLNIYNVVVFLLLFYLFFFMWII